MYHPEIGKLYASKEGQDYYLITAFENPNSEDIRVNFQTPGSNRVFERKGIYDVSEFLYSITPVSSVPSELENLANQERELSRTRDCVRAKKAFLHQHSLGKSSASKAPVSVGSDITPDSPDRSGRM